MAPILTDTFEISIHALREEGDQDWSDRMLDLILFLSTPSARRATSREAGGEEDTVISIHALREEGDGQGRPRSSW